MTANTTYAANSVYVIRNEARKVVVNYMKSLYIETYLLTFFIVRQHAYAYRA